MIKFMDIPRIKISLGFIEGDNLMKYVVNRIKEMNAVVRREFRRTYLGMGKCKL